MKICTKCHNTKPLTEFHANCKKHDGLHPWCKSCRSAHRKATYDPDKERAYRDENADAERSRKQAYFAANWRKVYAKQKRWEQANPGKAKARRRRYEDKHGNRGINRLQQFIDAHPHRRNMASKELRDKYVAFLMTRRSTTLNPTDIPQGLIDAKREQLRILRELKKGMPCRTLKTSAPNWRPCSPA